MRYTTTCIMFSIFRKPVQHVFYDMRSRYFKELSVSGADAQGLQRLQLLKCLTGLKCSWFQAPATLFSVSWSATIYVYQGVI